MSRSSQRRNFTISQCVCPVCGKSFPIPRGKNKAREKGHIKDIWCPFCKKIEKMSEIRSGDFLFKKGIF